MVRSGGGGRASSRGVKGLSHQHVGVKNQSEAGSGTLVARASSGQPRHAGKLRGGSRIRATNLTTAKQRASTSAKALFGCCTVPLRECTVHVKSCRTSPHTSQSELISLCFHVAPLSAGGRDTFRAAQSADEACCGSQRHGWTRLGKSFLPVCRMGQTTAICRNGGP